MSKHKKSRNKKIAPDKLNLITAILNLIVALMLLIDKLK